MAEITGAEAVSELYKYRDHMMQDPSLEDLLAGRDWLIALTEEVGRMAYEIMHYQLGYSYQEGYEHGVQAALKYFEKA